jgi:uncharacterized protein (DUF1501 family)
VPSQLSQIARTRHDSILALIANDNLIARVVLETQITQKSGGVLVCGSSGEIAPEANEDDYFDYWNWRLDSSKPESEQKKTVWTNIALSAPDQLCQRTAFALSQIFAISPNFLAYNPLSEAYTNFYDGFVRNCHNPYKTVLKVIAFSVKMGMQLSHVGSTSLRYGYDRGGQFQFPDENFARESMQLETIGLDSLNMDGTLQRDSDGDLIPTYDTTDILTFARAWTGFEYSNRRGNYEENDPIEKNWNDPMILRDGDRHDWWPKKDLLDGWIGDRYPLCSDLPPQAFLKAGATFKLLGRSSSPRYQFDNENWDGDEAIKRLTLSTGSSLYNVLCAPDSGQCTYPTVVELEADISPCTGGFECSADTLRVVQVAPDVFYEFVRRPCVHLAFLDPTEAKSVFAGGSYGASMCADPTQPVATNTCCPNGSSKISCKYHGERVTYATNNNLCSGNGGVCPAGTNDVADSNSCLGQTAYNVAAPKYNHFQWTEGSCTTKVKVRLDGMLALVHFPESANKVVKYVENGVGNMNYFHVPWPRDPYLKNDELFPHIDNACGEGTCVEQDDWTCLCDVTITNAVAFTGNPENEEAIWSRLKIGAFPPDYLGGYEAGFDLFSGAVTVYHKSGQGYTSDTIFKLSDTTDEFIEFGSAYERPRQEGDPIVGVVYLKNLVSDIQIGDTENDYYSAPARTPLVMRNPLMFHDLVAPAIRDAHYEIDAVIHHLTSHPSAAPFICAQLIQHFGIANPSPGYIERVATVYREGRFTFNSNDFGDGKHSSLDAVVAAILLDREAVATTLDADPTYGGLKEPIIKVLQFMRAGEYVQNPFDRNIYPKFRNMVGKIGQMAHESPDQFSFFLPDYSPPGQMAQAKIFAPVGQILTLYTTIGTVEGLFSLARHGLSASRGGFGNNNFGNDVTAPGDASRSVGYLSFNPNLGTDQANVQLISDLLTGGRLSSEAVSAVATKVGDTAGLTDQSKVTLAQQLIGTAPEYHTTNLAERTGQERAPTPVQEAADDPYKAVVVLFLSGGVDWFNVLAPHTSCSLFSSYRNNREVLALQDTEMMPITTDNPDQPCTEFGIHEKIPVFKTLYDDGYGQFHANIGHLHKPVTKGNWYTETRTHLFSHKTMEREAQLVDAFQEDGWSTGVGGRMLDVLQRRGLSVNAIGINGKGPLIEGNPSLGRTVDVIPAGGVNLLNRVSLTGTSNDVASIESTMEYLNQETSLQKSGVFANYWSQNLVDVLNKTDVLSTMLASSQASLHNEGSYSGTVGGQLKMVAKLMLLHDVRESNRDFFLLHQGGHDGHAQSKNNLNNLLPDVNSGIQAFYDTMVDKDMMDHLTFVVISEFGRTITPNSGKGSDHAWGGNSFVWGGEVKGSTILGQYPTSFDDTGVENIGRGRLIPSKSWESMWYGIANWFGITNETEIEYVLPNNGNMGCDLYTDRDMYNVGNTTINGCNDRSVGMKLSMLLKEPRYLSGMEQKKICKAAIALVSSNANVTSRCVVTDQKVYVYFDENRRQLLDASDVDERILQDAATFENVATIAFAYDNTNDTEDGTEYIEDIAQFTEHMNEAIKCPVSSGDSRRRRLEESENCLENCENVTGMEALVTKAPSLTPSVSSQPSGQPSGTPSDQPTETPSRSNVPTEREPSFEPSTSISPTPPAPSAKPSAAPSSSPTKDCPNVIDDCLNGGMYSMYTCECICLSPFCPHADTGTCSENSCASDYHETVFDDQPAPWFKFGSSCASSKELPSYVWAIYGSKEICCQNEHRDNPSSCVQRTPELSRLSYYAELQLIGVNCPNSGSERAAAAGIVATSILSTVCSNAPGLSCGEGDKVVVTKFCGTDYNTEAEYSSGSRRLTVTDDDIVEFVLYFEAFESTTLREVESLLSSYLQGTTLTTFLTALLTDILASNPPPTLQNLTGILYTALRAFIDSLGLYYPAWGQAETCFNDGEQEVYMNRNPGEWLYETLESCCDRYYEWDVPGCKLRHAQATLISGTIEDVVDLTDDMYYPDWGRTDNCIKGETAPPYMKKKPDLWMYESLADCCKAYYGWEAGYEKCTVSEGGDPPTRSPISDTWYVSWKNWKCTESQGEHKPWDILHSSKYQCCQEQLWWVEDCMLN